MSNQTAKTIKNYIFIFAVVIFGAWLLTDKPDDPKIGETTNQDNSIIDSDVIADSESNVQIVTGDTTAELSNAVVAKDHTNTDYDAENTDNVSDDVWFSTLMKKARTIQDRIINIDITGAGYTDVGNITDDNQNKNIIDEGMLPQPTETESLAENKVDCPSSLYMGGNDYGRNMLASMGCPPVPAE